MNVNCTLSYVDSFNPVAVVSGNQGPSQMMGIAGRVGAMGPEGSSNMGTHLIPDNGVMVMYLCLASIIVQFVLFDYLFILFCDVKVCYRFKPVGHM